VYTEPPSVLRPLCPLPRLVQAVASLPS
jgi:hypothetical protein